MMIRHYVRFFICLPALFSVLTAYVSAAALPINGAEPTNQNLASFRLTVTGDVTITLE